MARRYFGTGGDKCDFSWLKLPQQIESPMAFWPGTVIEKGQLAYSGSGCELTGEIWSWGLPEEKGVLREICVGQGWPTTLNHSWLKNLGEVESSQLQLDRV
ncbi:unnamed protein product [Pleuronectes platessa]|uniref:Uncharacterized protein n=1 Tax=Pleuronectes platessa TaxID=8262 RepID=A0A9N7YVW8_PLEPL|nr:unnamed protein product [Pleuronectes platessa]